MEEKALVTININNQVAIKPATNLINYSNMKYIRMRYHFIRQLVTKT